MTKHVPRTKPSSPASVGAGFVEIGHVQLSRSNDQARKLRQALHNRQTDQLNSVLEAPAQPAVKSFFSCKQKSGLAIKNKR